LTVRPRSAVDQNTGRTIPIMNAKLIVTGVSVSALLGA
jgi:hypothetical protein